jgi:hypothetical protein
MNDRSAEGFEKSALVPFVSNGARMERSGMRDSCRSHHTPSWIALRFIQAPHLPTVIYAVGVIVLAAAILLVILVGTRLDILIQWWSEQSSLLTRVSCLVSALVGMLVWYNAVAGQYPNRAA